MTKTNDNDTNPVTTARSAARGLGRGTIIGATLIVIFAVVVLYLVYQQSQGEQHATGPDQDASEEGGADVTAGKSGYKHAEGDPGAGAEAPAFTLPSSAGDEVSLTDFQGENVLLYVHGGLMCQPCIDQITDLEDNEAALDNAGVDTVVSITHDSPDQINKVADGQLSTPWLSDPNLDMIREYDAHSYGMMNGSAAGHTFILIGPDGEIEWRADYGGAPDYTMFLPTEDMLADLSTERSS